MPQSLSRTSDFRRVSGEGRRSRRNGVGVAALQRGDSAPARIGYAVRRTTGPAVTRNRIKRRLRAAVREVELRAGVDVVMSGDAEVASVDFQVLVEKTAAALRAVGAAR